METMRLPNPFRFRSPERTEESKRVVREAGEAREEAFSVLHEARAIYEDVARNVKGDHIAPLFPREKVR